MTIEQATKELALLIMMKQGTPVQETLDLIPKPVTPNILRAYAAVTLGDPYAYYVDRLLEV